MKIHYCGWDESCQISSRLFKGPRNRRLHIDTLWFHAYIDIVHWGDRGLWRTNPGNHWKEPDG